MTQKSGNESGNERKRKITNIHKKLGNNGSFKKSKNNSI
jgi:hypothetical protein